MAMTLAELLAMQQDNTDPGVQYQTGQPTLASLTKGRTEEEINQLLSGMQIRSPGFDPNFMSGEPYMPPQAQQMPQNYVQRGNNAPIDMGQRQPMPQNYIQRGNNAPIDLGQSQRQHDVYRDGPQVLGREQMPDGRTLVTQRVAARDGDGRMTAAVRQVIETPDYLNPAKLKELEFRKKQAELTQLQAKPNSAMEKMLAEIQSEKMKAQIPGTAEYDRVQKQNAGVKKEESAWQGSIRQAEDMTGYIDSILGEGQYKDKGSKLGFFSTGLPGQVLQNVGGTDARNLRGDIDRIKANIGFEELNKMRRESPTGGALGQVTERELQFLQSVQGSLDQAQTPEQLERMLNDIKLSTARLKNDLLKNPPKGMSGGGQVSQKSGAEQPTSQLQEGQLGTANGRPTMVKDGKWVYLK